MRCLIVTLIIGFSFMTEAQKTPADTAVLAFQNKINSELQDPIPSKENHLELPVTAGVMAYEKD